MRIHTLLVEDTLSLAETVIAFFELEGIDCDYAATGPQGLELALSNEYQTILLDINLPRMNGLEVCEALRHQGVDVPVLMLTARDTLEDKLAGFDAGTDDYLIKPFGIRELVARCRALLRRSRDNALAGRVLQHANLRLYPEECRVLRDGNDINLSPKEYRLLELFMRHPRRVWSRDQLLEQVWGFDFFGDSKTVDVHIRWLREKLENNPSAPEHLITVRGFGYRFG